MATIAEALGGNPGETIMEALGGHKGETIEQAILDKAAREASDDDNPDTNQENPDD